MIRPTRIAPLLFLLLCASVFSQTITGRVVRVIDGDTISALSDRTEVRIRLAECDSPGKLTALRVAS